MNKREREAVMRAQMALEWIASHSFQAGDTMDKINAFLAGAPLAAMAASSALKEIL